MYVWNVFIQNPALKILEDWLLKFYNLFNRPQTKKNLSNSKLDPVPYQGEKLYPDSDPNPNDREHCLIRSSYSTTNTFNKMFIRSTKNIFVYIYIRGSIWKGHSALCQSWIIIRGRIHVNFSSGSGSWCRIFVTKTLVLDWIGFIRRNVSPFFYIIMDKDWNWNPFVSLL